MMKRPLTKKHRQDQQVMTTLARKPISLQSQGSRALAVPWVFLLMMLGTMTAWSADLTDLKRSHQARLDGSLEALAQEREDLRKAMLPLTQSVRQLKTEERVWRKKMEEWQSVQDSKTLSLDDLKAQVKDQEDELRHLEDALLREFVVEERASLPAHDQSRETLRLLDLSLESGELNAEQSLQKQLNVITDVLSQLRSSVGGEKLKGRALDERGRWLSGEIVDIGPEQFFFEQATGDGSDKNLKQSSAIMGRLKETGDGQPLISSRDQMSLQQWKQEQLKTLPLDVSGGDALKAAEIQTTWWEHVEKGGLWVYPIVAFALLAGLTALIKLLSLYSMSVSSPKVGHELSKLILAGDHERAFVLAKSQPRCCRQMWLNTLERGQGHPELCEEVMSESMMEAQPKFERFLSFIAVTAAIAPLLGLLGTVTGIIKTFQMMEVFGAGDPKPLIGGISEALITTELGLILAIPALLLHALLSRRSQSLLAKMERASVAFCNGLLSQTIGDRKLGQAEQGQ